MNDNSEIPSKDEIIKNMAKHFQTNMEDGEEVLLRTYDLAFIKGKMEAIKEMKKQNWKLEQLFLYFSNKISGQFIFHYMLQNKKINMITNHCQNFFYIQTLNQN